MDVMNVMNVIKIIIDELYSRELKMYEKSLFKNYIHL